MDTAFHFNSKDCLQVIVACPVSPAHPTRHQEEPRNPTPTKKMPRARRERLEPTENPNATLKK
jgi:hypothetical protein